MSGIALRAGLDLGGTKCFGVVLDVDDRIVREVRLPTPRGADAIISTLTETAVELAPFDVLGVGVPGLVDRAGRLWSAPNLPGVSDLDVAGRLGEALESSGLPSAGLTVDSDATCATVAEWRLGAGTGVDDLVMVTFGTGIGGGAVLGGQLQRGHNGFAGEYGHMVVDPDGPACVCGRRGCWERFASGAGLARLARAAVLDGRAAGLADAVDGDLELLRGEHVRAAAVAGDPAALAVIDQFGRWVALGLVNLTNALDPELLVVGGGVLGNGVVHQELWLEPIRRWFGEFLYAPDLRPHPQIEMASWDERAGAVGAAVLAGT